MEVKADGKPQPKIRWYKQGEELTTSKDFQIEEAEDGTSVLTISEVYPDDTGEIICVAQNNYGVDTTETVLMVEGRSKNILHRVTLAQFVDIYNFN